jgi:hypothetical protein
MLASRWCLQFSMVMGSFEAEVTRDINFITGLALFDPHIAFTTHISERARLMFGFNDDISAQAVSDGTISQFFITELGVFSCEDRRVVPQVVIVRNIARDFSEELGWQIGIVEDFPLGAMTQAEQREYYDDLPNHLCPIDPEDIDEALLAMAEAEEAWFYY